MNPALQDTHTTNNMLLHRDDAVHQGGPTHLSARARLKKVEFRGNVPAFACRKSGKPFSTNHPEYTQLGLNHGIPVIDSLVYCESSALDHAAIEVGRSPTKLIQLNPLRCPLGLTRYSSSRQDCQLWGGRAVVHTLAWKGSRPSSFRDRNYRGSQAVVRTLAWKGSRPSSFRDRNIVILKPWSTRWLGRGHDFPRSGTVTLWLSSRGPRVGLEGVTTFLVQGP
uniref:Uncharacterized protein n=1 Tax=Timema bartmani TaxID=61472 RepID=A0A7R9EVR3_9NEOP|nr:unnamed protein product [Timema bartmani]